MSQGDLDTLESVTPADEEEEKSGAPEPSNAEDENVQDDEAEEEEANDTEEEVLPTSSHPETAVNSDVEDQEQAVLLADALPGVAMQVCFQHCSGFLPM